MQNNNHQPPAFLEPMSAADFAAWGTPELAFVKQVVADGLLAWSIHAADGTAIGSAPSRELAFAAIIQNELEPLSVH